MRGCLVWLAFVLVAACGTAPTPHPVVRPRAAVSKPARPALTRGQLLAALPADTNVLFAVDVRKLKQSEIAQRGWDMLRRSRQGDEIFGAMCGIETNITYALVAVDVKSGNVWAWIDGVPRYAKLDCAKSIEQRKANPERTTIHDDYELVTTDTHIVESLWVDDRRMLLAYHPAGQATVGEDRLRSAVANGTGIAGADGIGALLDRVDFESGVAAVINGGMTGQSGIGGVALSVELDNALRAQMYVQFDNEDRASELRAKYREILDAAVQRNLLESGEARVSGTGMAASVAMSRAQVDWWINAVTQFVTSPGSPPPAPPTP